LEKIENMKLKYLYHLLITLFALINSGFCNSQSDDCTDIKNFLTEQQLSYDSIIVTCKIDKDGNVYNL